MSAAQRGQGAMERTPVHKSSQDQNLGTDQTVRCPTVDMRLLALFSLLPLSACWDAPSQPYAPPRPVAPIIQKEPVSDDRADNFSGCSGPPMTPMLAILSSQTLLDGTPVGDSELESTLNAKQELNALLGGEPIREIVVQVGSKVPKAHVDRLLDRARSAGFVNVTRFAPIEESSQPKFRGARTSR